jgi:protocatechuate 3,4-dioxygenase beta subunit
MYSNYGPPHMDYRGHAVSLHPVRVVLGLVVFIALVGCGVRPSPLPAITPSSAGCTATVIDVFGSTAAVGNLPNQLQLALAGEPGQTLILSGTAFTADCRPLAGVQIEIEHADAAGQYTYLHGLLQTDAQGRYQVTTIKPGWYDGPAHFHFTVTHPQGGSAAVTLYFAGDPALASQTPVEPAPPILTLAEEQAGSGRVLRATFDFILRP